MYFVLVHCSPSWNGTKPEARSHIADSVRNRGWGFTHTHWEWQGRKQLRNLASAERLCQSTHCGGV